MVLTQQALDDAAAADRKRAAGEQLPLLGIPIAVKDDVDVAGVPTRFGAAGNIRPATADSEVVRRLRAAGAVIVGKTNTCELGQWPFTSGPAFGHTRNPWSRKHTPGGSSGGSAAAVAAGLVTAAIGSDGAGSVRIPAAWTHLVGIKPQRGRISTWPLPEAFNGITVNGVLARTVTDAALVLDAASGNADGDLHKPPPVRVSEYVGRAPGPLKNRAVDQVPDNGLPGQAASRRSAPRWTTVGESARGAGPHDRDGRPQLQACGCRGASCPGPRRACWTGPTASATTSPWTSAPWPTCGWVGCCRRTCCARPAPTRPTAQRRVGWIFNLVDVVLAPTTAQPPPPVHDFDHRGGLSTDRAMIRACPVTWPWNLLGWPSINVPAGFTSAGLPIGVQLMGPANSEPLLISLAAELEAINGWATKQPAIWWNTPVKEPVCGRRVVDHDRAKRYCALLCAGGAVAGMPAANADNRRLNESVVVNVYTVQHKAGCTTEIKINPKLRLAAQWHTNDVLNNRALDGDIGSDGSTVADRARNAGYAGAVAETVAINPALAISGVELINQWYLPARLLRDHGGLLQRRHRRVVGEPARPHRRGRGLRQG